MKKLPIEVDELTQKLKERENTSLNHEDIKTDKNIKLWTGTTNKVALDALFTAVTRNLKKVRYRSGPLKFSLKGKISQKIWSKPRPFKDDEFLLTKMKLRLGSNNADLTQRFAVSITNVSNIFTIGSKCWQIS